MTRRVPRSTERTLEAEPIHKVRGQRETAGRTLAFNDRCFIPRT